MHIARATVGDHISRNIRKDTGSRSRFLSHWMTVFSYMYLFNILPYNGAQVEGIAVNASVECQTPAV